MDIEVVRQSVRAIGQARAPDVKPAQVSCRVAREELQPPLSRFEAAIKLERSTEQCVNCLLELIKTRAFV